MDLKDLMNKLEQYDGNIKRMEMDKHLEKLKIVKNEDDIEVVDRLYKCECGSSSFTIQSDLEEMM